MLLGTLLLHFLMFSEQNQVTSFQMCLLSYVNMHIHSFFSLLFLLLLFSRADALFGYGLLCCQFTSPDDLVYVEQIYYNKVFLIEYNSTEGKYTGYTEKAKELADGLNKSPAMKRKEKKNEEKYRSSVPLILALLSKTVEPSVRVRSVEAAGSKHPGMLVCSVYGFYPKQIRVAWLRNGKEVTSEVTSTEELPNGNWLYQMHSYLEFTPRPGETITCKVEHASLLEPGLYDWDPAFESQRNKIAVGTAGLLLGLVFLVAGLIYYKKNTAGRVLVPTS
ncbi:rano class II histocompatibility antigen, A beta chain-like isoform X2 [Sebastes umbrosus]|uniref:rano class II histocompatibility antigen, A beta chain-like isoform X2 n=1 Tax=Sebastes umbrosus TaxID=72105 RepID=UPI0018A0B4B0|nr:rano class II histocompatibility antigen, A beta chain-like isoform X2 [Sebastes umbrosus]